MCVDSYLGLSWKLYSSIRDLKRNQEVTWLVFPRLLFGICLYEPYLFLLVLFCCFTLLTTGGLHWVFLHGGPPEYFSKSVRGHAFTGVYDCYSFSIDVVLYSVRIYSIVLVLWSHDRLSLINKTGVYRDTHSVYCRTRVLAWLLECIHLSEVN